MGRVAAGPWTHPRPNICAKLTKRPVLLNHTESVLAALQLSAGVTRVFPFNPRDFVRTMNP